jgi:hypothetical protein
VTPELVEPTTRRYDAWQDARDDRGPGLHEDGFGPHRASAAETTEG